MPDLIECIFILAFVCLASATLFVGADPPGGAPNDGKAAASRPAK